MKYEIPKDDPLHGTLQNISTRLRAAGRWDSLITQAALTLPSNRKGHSAEAVFDAARLMIALDADLPADTHQYSEIELTQRISKHLPMALNNLKRKWEREGGREF